MLDLEDGNVSRLLEPAACLLTLSRRSWLSFQHHFVRYHEQMKTGYWEPMFKSTVEDSAGARMSVPPLPTRKC